MRRFELAPLPGESDRRNRTVDADPERVLENLNPAQQEAVRQTEGPVMIIAGAGSGKTRTLTHRIAYLLATETTDASRILALTFTNKAASEMKERVFELVGTEGARGLWMGTFHSIFARLLRREAEAIGYTADFSIYDTDDSRRIIKNLMERYGFDTSRFKPRSLHSMISNAKNNLVSPAEYQESAYGPYEERVGQLFGPYQETLKRSNAMDFDDLLLKPIELFEKEPDVLARYQNRWRYIHIDEYQDTNRAQYRLAQLLADSHKNLCVVGDDAQSIYKFRGADIRNILDFRNDFPRAEVVRLEQNYRSTKHILQLADSVIEHNTEQIEKTLWTDNEEGEPVQLFRAMSEKDEARKIAQSIKNLRMREGYSWDDFAILYRTNAQSRSLEERLRQQDIPYQVVGGLSFYERKEIKDVLAYLQLVVNPHDVASLRRVINYPRRGIGQRTQEKIEKLARQRDIPVWEALHHVGELGLRTRQENSVREFRELIEKYASLLDEEPADEVGRALIEETGILEDLRNEDTAESLSRWENVQELLNAITEFVEDVDEDDQGLNRFLQEVSLMTDVDGMEDEGAQVTLLTLHASKGLEFPVVFVTGLEEGLFPLSRATEVKEELEEERRLFYVGVTRAEERLFLTYAITRYQYGQHKDTTKSRFLDEIDTSVVRDESGSRPRETKGRFSGGNSSSRRGAEADGERRTIRTSSASGSSTGRRVVYDEGEAGPIVPGVRVEHDKFGEGKVLSVDGQGPKAKATVFFNDVGQKKLMLQYAGLRVVE